jgi:hypothetical protein
VHGKINEVVLHIHITQSLLFTYHLQRFDQFFTNIFDCRSLLASKYTAYIWNPKLKLGKIAAVKHKEEGGLFAVNK